MGILRDIEVNFLSLKILLRYHLCMLVVFRCNFITFHLPFLSTMIFKEAQQRCKDAAASPESNLHTKKQNQVQGRITVMRSNIGYDRYLCTGLLDALFHRYGNSFQQLLQLQLLLLRDMHTFTFSLLMKVCQKI